MQYFFIKKENLNIYSIYIIGGNEINYIDNNYKKKYSRFKINLLNQKYIKKELRDSDYILSNINGYSLDRDQRVAIITDEFACLIVAGAGSGKSLTMIGKIRYLIERKKIKEEEILCMTFTNDAASSLEEGIKKNYNYNIKVYTFHKLALELLKEKHLLISNSDTLNYIIDEYFNSIIYNNEDMIIKTKKIIGKIDTPYKHLTNTSDLISLKRLIITFINLFKTNNYDIEYFLSINYNRDLISIIIDIYYLYEEELKSTNSIDFNDMIVLATKVIAKSSVSHYKYIIVDEYQDTSYIRYLFLYELIKRTNAKIICVGDDYQSIYRFNGCNLNMFINFKKHFGYSKVLKINTTYRNSQELIDVAGSFIMKNKRQLYKKLKSKKRFNKPIKIVYGNNLTKILDIVINKYTNIFILGRNNFDIDRYFKIDKEGFINYKGVEIQFLTIHAAKGLESDCVIVINLIDDVLGFPNKIIDNKILKYVNNNKDIYPYEEERRLFYVALTRTKNEVYLLANKQKPSIFIKELINDYYEYIEYI